MAVTDPYAVPDDYRDYWRVSDSDSAPNRDEDIRRVLLACSRLIDRKTRRFFERDAADVQRTFVVDPLQPDLTHLTIDDLVSATTVTLDLDNDGDFTDDTALTVSTDYELLPRNAALGPEARPYTELHLTPWGGTPRFPSTFPCRVQIDGIWGWPAVPEAVRHACIELAGIVRIQSPRATSQIQGGPDVVIEASAEGQRIIKDLVMQYRRNDL